jgi:hypothetical protein
MQEIGQANPYFLHFDTNTIENISFLHPQIVQTNLPFDDVLKQLRQEYEELVKFVRNFENLPKLPGKPSVNERIKSKEDYENLETEFQMHKQKLEQYNEKEFEGSMFTRQSLARDTLYEIDHRTRKTRWWFISKESQDSIRIKIQQVYAFWLYRALFYLNPYLNYELYKILQIPWRRSNLYDWELKKWSQNIELELNPGLRLLRECTQVQDIYSIQNAYALLFSPTIRQKYIACGDYKFVQTLTPEDMTILKSINERLSELNESQEDLNLAEFTTCAVCLEPQYVMSLLRICANSNEQEQVLPQQHVRKHLVCAVCAQKWGEKCPICKQRGPWNLVTSVTPKLDGGFQEFTSNERFTSLCLPVTALHMKREDGK